MRTVLVYVLAMLAAVTVVSAAPGGISLEPGAAYRMFIAADPTVDMQARGVLQVPVSYIFPLSESGVHNFKVIAGPDIGAGYNGGTIGLGYACAPKRPEVILGLGMVFDAIFPEADFAKVLTGSTSEEVWLSMGGEFSIDFVAPANIPAAIFAGAGYGFRDTPRQVWLGFRIGTQPASPSSRVAHY